MEILKFHKFVYLMSLIFLHFNKKVNSTDVEKYCSILKYKIKKKKS